MGPQLGGENTKDGAGSTGGDAIAGDGMTDGETLGEGTTDGDGDANVGDGDAPRHSCANWARSTTKRTKTHGHV
jgi:hypothetical protein